MLGKASLMLQEEHDAREGITYASGGTRCSGRHHVCFKRNTMLRKTSLMLQVDTHRLFSPSKTIHLFEALFAEAQHTNVQYRRRKSTLDRDNVQLQRKVPNIKFHQIFLTYMGTANSRKE